MFHLLRGYTNSEHYRHNNTRYTDGTIRTEIIRRSTSKVADVYGVLTQGCVISAVCLLLQLLTDT